MLDQPDEDGAATEERRDVRGEADRKGHRRPERRASAEIGASVCRHGTPEARVHETYREKQERDGDVDEEAARAGLRGRDLARGEEDAHADHAIDAEREQTESAERQPCPGPRCWR